MSGHVVHGVALANIISACSGEGSAWPGFLQTAPLYWGAVNYCNNNTQQHEQVAAEGQTSGQVSEGQQSFCKLCCLHHPFAGWYVLRSTCLCSQELLPACHVGDGAPFTHPTTQNRRIGYRQLGTCRRGNRAVTREEGKLGHREF